MLIVRFDFRLGPQSDTTMADLYATSLDMAEWAEANDAASVLFSQHHGSPDGYLPSPLVMAAAAAARTSSVPLNVGALLVLMYDPVKLAEDMVVLDHLSRGRVSYTIGLGYRDAEYAMFGVDAGRRAPLMEEWLDVLRRALRGERFDWDGRRIHVTPEPFTPGGPALAYGGGSVAAARRAARHGLVFIPQHGDPALAAAYDREAERAGRPTGLTLAPPPGAPTSVFVADDVDAAWDRLGPHLLHDALTYRRWMEPAGTRSASVSRATDVGDLRAEAGSYRIVSPAEAVELAAADGMLSIQPLCGGIPPDLAWESLHLIEREVLPALG
jgi:alkanesulfonate monooxygenase SsuD/methylene tetrahydromethanopterin reductase-like flavin-dependent oxidoreductase (luciferase family)